jgi:hypothetical protein
VVDSLTTATSQTTALPDGQLRLTESLVPVRALRGGKWVPLDPALHAAAQGRLAPADTASPLSLSGGGSGPLAVLDSYGRTLTLTWPGGPLPAPVVSGPTATYPGVEPGIDLAVTATSQGSIDEAVIIHDAAAAASPALAAALRLNVTAPGMTLATSAGGGLDVTAGPGADPTFSSPAPRMWDSATPPAGTATGTIGGTTVVSPSGMPAASTVTAPGAYAHVWTAAQAASGGTVTVTPPSGTLTGAGTVYPVYVDPAWQPGLGAQHAGNAAAWTQIDKGLPSDTSDWDETSPGSYLQSGYCDPANLSGCNGIGVTRTMFRFPVPDLPSSTTVSSADISVENVWQSANCAAEPLQLWQTPAINSGTDWTNGSGWSSELEQETFAGFGQSGCPYSAGDVTFGTGSTATGGSAGSLATLLTTAADNNVTAITLGLRAADESTTDGTAWLQWRQLQASASAIQLSFNYYYPPAAPAVTTSPGGECQGSAAAAPVIGNDDISINATIAAGDGDTKLTTTTTVTSGGTTVAGPWTYGPGQGVTNQLLGTIPRGTLTTSGLYQVTVTTKDSFGETNDARCYFNFDLTAPDPPAVSGLPATATLGQQLSGISIGPPSTEDCSPVPSPCASSYTYQIGNLAPVTVTPNASHHVWNEPAGAITIPVLGPFIFRASAINSAGNVSLPATNEITSTIPATPLADGYFSAGHYPDLLTTDTAAGDASLWLSRGTGNGTLSPAIDIGGSGTGLRPGTDGPADWNNTAILHGDLTGHHLQDAAALYTAASTSPVPGSGVIIGGIGNTAALSPVSGNVYNIQQDTFCDVTFDATCQPPVSLAYAGDASQETTAATPTDGADIIGIVGTGGNYELALFTAFNTGNYNFDGTHGDLSYSASGNLSPDGTADWQDYTLTTLQLPDASHPNGDPDNTVLLAFNSTPGNSWSGQLYASVNPGCAAGACSAATLAGMPGTWVRVHGTPASWTTAPPRLASADVNNGSSGAGSGTPEIWTVAGGTATSYTISTITGATPSLTAGASSPLGYPNDSWALNDGIANPGTTTATDSIAGTAAPVVAAPGNTTWAWASDDSFGQVLKTSNGYVAPATDPVPGGDATPSISIWFKTTAASQALVSLETSQIASTAAAGSAGTGGYTPVLYIGTDGKLRAEWANGTTTPLSSASPVNDGLWHHATLTGARTSQTLTLDSSTQTLTGTINPTGSYFYIGTGLLGGNWPDENYFQQSGNTGYVTHFNGDIADVTFTR